MRYRNMCRGRDISEHNGTFFSLMMQRVSRYSVVDVWKNRKKQQQRIYLFIYRVSFPFLEGNV